VSELRYLPRPIAAASGYCARGAAAFDLLSRRERIGRNHRGQITPNRDEPLLAFKWP
jgi:hypothetical protein